MLRQYSRQRANRSRRRGHRRPNEVVRPSARYRRCVAADVGITSTTSSSTASSNSGTEQKLVMKKVRWDSDDMGKLKGKEV